MKKYKELQSNYDLCQEDLGKFKSSSIDNGNKALELGVELEVVKRQMSDLVKDSARLYREYDLLKVECGKIREANEALEKKYEDLLVSGNAQNAQLINDLEQTRVELQRQQDKLNQVEKELSARERVLQEKEKRITELEEMIAKKDEAVRLLKDKITAALRGFADRGITVEERNGRLYVSMEAELLFASGKTDVNKEGQQALTDLAKVLQSQKDIDIVVEGHTDTDPMKSSAHPKDN